MMKDLLLFHQIEDSLKGIRAIQQKLQNQKSLTPKCKARLEKKIKQLAFLCRNSMQALGCLQEQKKVINYAKFCIDVILHEGEGGFQKKTNNGTQEHPVIAPKFRELFPDADIK